MKIEWIYFLIAIFLGLRKILSQSKKQNVRQGEQEKLKQAADRLKNARTARVAQDTVRPALSSRTVSRSKEVRQVLSSTTDYEAAYESASFTETNSDSSSNSTVSVSSENNIGVGTYRESEQERAAYDTAERVMRIPSIPKTTDDYRRFIVAKEIFDKPKALKRFGERSL